MASFLWPIIPRGRRWSPQQPALPPGQFSGRPVKRTARACAAAVAAAAVAVVPVLVTDAAPASAGVRAGAPAPPAFQAAIQQLVTDGVPGAIGYARHGSQVTVATAGLADLATRTPMAAGDRVRVGSVTKTFVATVVLQLVAEHRLSLGDTVDRWLPGLVPDGAGITVQELLQHTSGIYSYSSDPGFQQALAADPTRVWQPAELVRIAVAHPPVFPPGTSWAYSNTDYVLLGLIIQAVTDHSVGQELQARIFHPLGLRDTYYPYVNPHLRKPYAHGYLLGQPGATGPADGTVMSPSWAGAAGGIVSTAADIARFYTALLTGKLLPAAQLQEMLTTTPTRQGDNYGLGIQAEPFPCGTVWGHQGSFHGYFSSPFTTTDGSSQAVIMVNADSGTLTRQQQTDIVKALFTGICGSS
jgi:D-alanyl-D-alanine carboxypeptidase